MPTDNYLFFLMLSSDAYVLHLGRRQGCLRLFAYRFPLWFVRIGDLLRPAICENIHQACKESGQVFCYRGHRQVMAWAYFSSHGDRALRIFNGHRHDARHMRSHTTENLSSRFTYCSNKLPTPLPCRYEMHEQNR